MDQSRPSQFSVGWHRIDITPDLPLPLDGMGNDYVRRDNWIVPQGEEDRLKASLLVIADGVDWQNTVVLCAMDTLFIHELFSNPASQAVARAIGIPANHVFFSGSHTHSGVSMDEQDPAVLDYNARLCEALARAAEVAVRDLAPARLHIGSVQTQGMNAQRRYILKDGTHRSAVHDKSYTTDDIVGYETCPDPYLRAIRITRPQPHKELLLVNWQMHPGYTGSLTEGRVSADIIGTIRQALEAWHPDTCFAFFQGAGGNMSRSTRWQQDPGYEKMKALGRVAYAEEFVRILYEDIAYTPAASGMVRVSNCTLTVRQKKGREVLDATHTLPLNAVSFGDVAVCTGPGEMFSDSGLQLRERSPFAMTFLCTNANGCYGYLPVKESFAGETYTHVNPQGDSFEVRVSKCEPGTAEKIVQTLVNALESHK